MRIYNTKYRTRKLELIGTVFKIVKRKNCSQKYRVRILDLEENSSQIPESEKHQIPK